jgi:hypothetical protein
MGIGHISKLEWDSGVAVNTTPAYLIYQGVNYPLGNIQSESGRKQAPILKIELPGRNADGGTDGHKGIQITGAYKDITINGRMDIQTLQKHNSSATIGHWIADIEGMIHGGKSGTGQTLQFKSGIAYSGSGVTSKIWNVVMENFDYTYVAGTDQVVIDYSMSLWVGNIV